VNTAGMTRAWRGEQPADPVPPPDEDIPDEVEEEDEESFPASDPPPSGQGRDHLLEGVGLAQASRRTMSHPPMRRAARA